MITLKKHSNNFSFKVANSYIPIEESLIPYLCEEMELEKGVTFEDFFNIILKYHEEYSKVFVSHLSGVSLSEFMSEWAKLPDKEDSDNMKRIVISWEDMYEFGKDIIKDGLEIPWLPDFFGEGVNGKGEDVSYSIEFTPLNKLKKYPFELITNSKLYDIETNKELLFMNRTFTVYEVLSAVFYEITFTGTPAMRDKKIKSLGKTTKSMMDELGNPTKYKTLDEILKKLKIDLPKEKE